MSTLRKSMVIRASFATLMLITLITLFLHQRVVATTERISFLYAVVVINRCMSRAHKLAHKGLAKAQS